MKRKADNDWFELAPVKEPSSQTSQLDSSSRIECLPTAGHFSVIHSQNRSSFVEFSLPDTVDPAGLAYAHTEIERKPVQDLIYKMLGEWITVRYHSPSHILLGWRTYYQASNQEACRVTKAGSYQWQSSDVHLTELFGLPVLVDDSVADLISFIPHHKHISPRGP